VQGDREGTRPRRVWPRPRRSLTRNLAASQPAKLRQMQVEKTQPNIFSADETADVGIDNQTPVAEGIGIGPDSRFTGKINKITLEVSPMK
jgi:hypothetical protein